MAFVAGQCRIVYSNTVLIGGGERYAVLCAAFRWLDVAIDGQRLELLDGFWCKRFMCLYVVAVKAQKRNLRRALGLIIDVIDQTEASVTSLCVCIAPLTLRLDGGEYGEWTRPERIVLTTLLMTRKSHRPVRTHVTPRSSNWNEVDNLTC